MARTCIQVVGPGRMCIQGVGPGRIGIPMVVQSSPKSPSLTRKVWLVLVIDALLLLTFALAGRLGRREDLPLAVRSRMRAHL